jgi:hypothetical protein
VAANTASPMVTAPARRRAKPTVRRCERRLHSPTAAAPLKAALADQRERMAPAAAAIATLTKSAAAPKAPS